ncbi:MAG: ribosome recycling factor [Candidatus Pacebacteria bacterium]|nr:ribosome recycling factor [Candidatus Paceibacterota bacterium]
MNEFILSQQTEFDKAIDFFKKEISTIRTGRANPALLDSVSVEAYGINNKLQAVANVSVMDAKTISVTPWDKAVLKNIEKAITEANLGLSARNEGDKLLLILPQLTEESRQEYVKKLNEKHEKARIALRQIREEIKDKIEKAEEDKEITEDDKFVFIKELDEKISQLNTLLKELRDKKEQDIMTV